MRIAFVMNLAPRKLGSFEGWVVALCQETRRRGHSVDVFGHSPCHPLFLRALCAAEAGYVPLEALSAFPARGVLRLSRYDVAHLNLFAPRSAIALIAYAALPTRVLWVDHTSAYIPGPCSGRDLVRRSLDRVTMLRVHSYTGVSEFVRSRSAARFHLPAARTRVIYNGVDVSRFAPRGASANGGPLRLLAVAHLIREKGIAVAVEALSRMQTPARLVVAGDGPEADRIRALAGAAGVRAQVEMLGLRDDVPALLERTDVFVHPALWGEAFGLTIAEAMAAGLPVVASRAGAIPELVADGETGILVPPGDHVALAAVLDRLARSPAERARLGNAGRRRAVERFELSACIRAHIDWCEQAVSRHAAAAPEGHPAGGSPAP